jgi:hypothetical protein
MSEHQHVIGMDQLSHLAFSAYALLKERPLWEALQASCPDLMKALGARFYGEWQHIITTAGAAGEHASETVRVRLVPLHQLLTFIDTTRAALNEGASGRWDGILEPCPDLAAAIEVRFAGARQYIFTRLVTSPAFEADWEALEAFALALEAEPYNVGLAAWNSPAQPGEQ